MRARRRRKRSTCWLGRSLSWRCAWISSGSIRWRLWLSRGSSRAFRRLPWCSWSSGWPAVAPSWATRLMDVPSPRWAGQPRARSLPRPAGWFGRGSCSNAHTVSSAGLLFTPECTASGVSRRSRTVISWRRSIGFTTWLLKPAARVRSWSESWPYPVTAIRIGFRTDDAASNSPATS